MADFVDINRWYWRMILILNIIGQYQYR